ncbi:hypothetical protein CALCODRAFT_479131 [Calocera cornea HHB12733]|uniref:Uncharacterized protein n=1 Tax=Calocera cornea HHB12733 TaxID=1353952 RepID=A0A165K1I5_9BASI|nr:hypothetical protein CALCODRAFT_479131 [Calocera cornea HHB12733]
MDVHRSGDAPVFEFAHSPVFTSADVQRRGALYLPSARYVPLGTAVERWLKLLILTSWAITDDLTGEVIDWSHERIEGLPCFYGGTGRGPARRDEHRPEVFSKPGTSIQVEGRRGLSISGQAYALPDMGPLGKWNNEFYLLTAVRRSEMLTSGNLLGPIPRRFTEFGLAARDVEHAGRYFGHEWRTALSQVFVYYPDEGVVLLLHDPHPVARPSFEAWIQEQSIQLQTVCPDIFPVPYTFDHEVMVPPDDFRPPLVRAWESLGAMAGFEPREWKEHDFPGWLFAQIVSFRGGGVDWDLTDGVEGHDSDDDWPSESSSGEEGGHVV